MLQTDYLVIGAGAASMAFVDTLLTEQPTASVVIVDSHASPGGHWNDAYDFVRLHQPSLLYGVSSSQMEGNWMKLLVSQRTLPWNHRATKSEILSYYQNLMDRWVRSAQVQYYPNCKYNFSRDTTTTITTSNQRTFTSLDGTNTTYNVRVSVKVVNGILGECRVPSKTPPFFDVDESVNILTPNQLYDFMRSSKASSSNSWFSSSSNKTTDIHNYVVLGAGKTAMDSIVYLQRHGVRASRISWVVPNDVWVIRREGPGTPWSFGDALLEHDLNVDAASLHLEERGVLTRLDRTIMPTRFRFPVVGADEMKLLKKLEHVIRRGRVTAIGKDGKVSFTHGDPLVFDDDAIFVHCTSPGPFNGNTETQVFPSDDEIRLCFLYAPPVPISMSSIAVLESRRRNGTLDVDFGRKLVQCLQDDDDGVKQHEQHPDTGKPISENDVLNALISGYNIAAKDDVAATSTLSNQIVPLKTLACFMALLDSDAQVAQNWLSANRLSFFSIPGFKGEVYEKVLRMMEKKETVGLSSQEVKMLSLVANKLKPLKGK